jgi:hypothetical protein
MLGYVWDVTGCELKSLHIVLAVPAVVFLVGNVDNIFSFKFYNLNVYRVFLMSLIPKAWVAEF